MPGVTVTAINTGTTVATEAVTDEAGNYTIRNLVPGIYDITAVLQGFRELRQRGMNITAGNIVRADIALQLGQLSETVNVVAESTLLQTERADLNTELSAKAVTNLPLNQFRNYQTLLNLVPGATPTQLQNSEIDTPARSLRTWVNGVQPNANTTRVDGAVSVNVWLPHHAMYVQSAESIDTVNIATNNFDADTGMAAGAAQSVITKSGTNDVRGSAFLFWNTDSFNSITYDKDYFGQPKNKEDTYTFGGTVGGPVMKNKLFYFFSWERFDTTRPIVRTYAVPTAKMRAGDFSEVAAAYPTFKLFNPFSDRTGAAREQWTNNIVPAQYITSIAQNVMKFYPAVNSAKDLNSNLLFDDYEQVRQEYQKRDNFDLKINWQVKPTAMVWGKIGYMDNQGSGTEFYLGFDDPSSGRHARHSDDVRHHLDAGPVDGSRCQLRHEPPGSDRPPAGPGPAVRLCSSASRARTIRSDPRSNGLPRFEGGGYTIGNAPSWQPLWRKEISYSGTLALTKVFAKHEMRTGMDFVRLELNHRQAEWGPYGLKGGFSFSNNTTGAVGYTSPGYNGFAAFLMGLPNTYSKDTQTEEMTGRENQFAFYIRDRWNVGPKLTVSAGVRLDYYPLMSRVGRGIETLNYDTYVVTLGGIGGQPNDAGVQIQKWYLEPRLGVAYRLNENNVLRAGYGQTRNPLPWSRPMRGSYPFDINNNASATGTYDYVTTLQAGIPAVVLPDTSKGTVVLPRGVFIRSPNVGNEAFPGSGSGVDRGRIQQWNVSFERRLPWNISAEVAYVGTATDGGYADLNYNVGVPGGGGTAAKYYASAGTSAINDWAARTKARYQGLQFALNRPFKNGLMLKGAYTWSQAKNMTSNDEDGWVGLTWNYAPKYDDNFAIAGFDRHAHVQHGLGLRAAVPQEPQRRPGHDPRRLATQRRLAHVLGHAVLDRRHEQRHGVSGMRFDPDQPQRRSEGHW